MSELPKGWAIATLPEVAKINPTIDKSAYSDDLEVSFVPMPAVEAETGKIDVSQIKKFGEVKKGYTPFLQHDVLFAKITPCMENGKMAVVPALHNDIGFGSTEFHVLRAYEGIEPRYLYYFVSSKAYRYDAEHNMAGAVGQKRVPTPYIEKSQIPLPPANEQKRIVVKIEELFSELDSGIESLKTARAQLKIYRQAVLKHAFEGKLTAPWRERNKDKLEAAEQLLKRIIPGGKKSQVVTEEERSKLLALPETWQYARLAEIATIGSGMSVSKNREVNDPVEVPYLRVANVQRGKLSLEEIKTMRIEKARLPDLELKQWDVLFNEGGDRDKLGRGWIWESQITPCITQNHVFRATTVLGLDFHAKFISHWGNSFGQAYFDTEEKQTTNLASINKGVLSRFPIPFPPLDEQAEIIHILEAQFSIIENLEATIEAELQKSEALRQSILKKAFSGQLVAQNPADEPASALLARIRAAKSAQKPAKASRTGKKKAPARTATVIQFPNAISSITTTDLHAGIIGMAYEQHEQHRRTNTFGHVKAEKIAHMVEYHLGIPLGRAPVKDAAGPNDYRHLKKVEHRANMANWFSVQQRPGGEGYVFAKKHGFNGLIAKTSQALGEKATEVEALLRLFLPLNTQQAEIIATLYAAWNNLLIAGSVSPSNEEIVTEARENWHKSKLNIERERFFRGLEWLHKKELIPSGIGAIVTARSGAA